MEGAEGPTPGTGRDGATPEVVGTEKAKFNRKPAFKKPRSANLRIRNKRAKSDDRGTGSSEEDAVEVVKTQKRSKKGFNNFSTSDGAGSAEARAATR